jgi:hypothetical protein
MNHAKRKSALVLTALVAAALVLLLGIELLAQTKGKKPRGRLPAYYNEVVTEKQRDAIYGITTKYDAEIDKLEAQIKDLKARRDAEIAALLTDEQKERIKKLQEEEKAQAEANRKAKEAAARKEKTKEAEREKP